MTDTMKRYTYKYLKFKNLLSKKWLIRKQASWQFLNNLDFLPIHDFLDTMILKDNILFFKRTNLGFLNIFSYCHTLSKREIKEKLPAKKINIDSSPLKRYKIMEKIFNN